MFDTFPLYSTLVRTTEVVMRVMRTALVIMGAIFVVALAHFFADDKSFADWLRPVVNVSPATLGLDEAAEEAETAEILSPRMQRALDYTSKRYRVSAQALQPIFEAAQLSGQEFRIDPLLIIAVIAIESRFNPLSESSVGAQGLMQVIPRYHKDKLPSYAGKLPLFDPVINVQVGTQALNEYIRRNGLIGGLQQFAGALNDPAQGYANKVLAEKQRLELAARKSGDDDA